MTPHRSVGTTVSTATLVVLFAGGASCAATPPSDGVAIDPPLSDSADPNAPPPDFTVHEWGLLDIQGDRANLLGAPEREPDPPRVMKKPVLYFHLGPSTPTAA